MINTSYFYNILRENINTFEEKHELESLDQDALYEAIGVMSKGMLNKIGAKSIDYGDIPDSKGRLEKVSGFANMKKIIDSLLLSNDKKVKDMASIVDRALSNLMSLSDLFIKGFRVNNNFIALFYNNYVYASIQATSYIVCYMNGSPKLIDNKCLKNLKTLNLECDKGNIRRIMNDLLNSNSENFLGTKFLGDIATASTAIAKGGFLAGGSSAAAAGATAAKGGALAAVGGYAGAAAIALVLAATIIPLTRELIYLFYSGKSKMSDFLAQQAKYVEISIDDENLQSNMSIDKKNKIVENKKKRVKELMNLSDKLAVSYSIADRNSGNDLKTDNKAWTLGDVKKDMVGDTQDIQLF